MPVVEISESKPIASVARQKDRHGLAILGLVPLVSFILNVRHKLPTIAADEVGFIAVARFLAGIHPGVDMSMSSYYPFGYSIMLAPLAWLFRHVETFYRAGVALNCLLLFFTSLLIKKSLDGLGRPRQTNYLVAFVSVLYPAYLQNAGILWSETAFAFVFAGCFYLAIAAATKSRLRDVLFLVIACCYAYAVHQRALLMPFAALAFVALLGLRRRLPWYAVGLTSVVALGFLYVVKELNSYFYAELWGAHEWAPLAHYSEVFTWRGISEVARAAIGQAWYLSFASLGLIFVSIYIALAHTLNLFRAVRPAKPCTPAVASAAPESYLFLILSAAGIFLASVFVMMVGTRTDTYVYGRYNEAFIAPFVAVALSWLADGLVPMEKRVRQIMWSGFALCALGLASAYALPAHVTLGVIRFTVPALAIFGAPFELPVWVLKGTTLATIAVMLLIVLVKHRPQLVLAIVGLVFFSEGVAAISAFERVRVSQEKRTLALREVAPSLPRFDVIVDRKALAPDLFFLYQADMPELKFRGVGDLPRVSRVPHFVVTKNSKEELARFDTRYILAEDPYSNVVLGFVGRPDDLLRGSKPPLSRNILARPGSYLSRGLSHIEGKGEAAVRWTLGSAMLQGRFPLDACSLKIVLSRPMSEPTGLTVAYDGSTPIERAAFSGSMAFSFPRPTSSDESFEIKINSGTFLPTNGDSRQLGVLLNRLSYEPCQSAVRAK